MVDYQAPLAGAELSDVSIDEYKDFDIANWTTYTSHSGRLTHENHSLTAETLDDVWGSLDLKVVSTSGVCIYNPNTYIGAGNAYAKKTFNYAGAKDTKVIIPYQLQTFYHSGSGKSYWSQIKVNGNVVVTHKKTSGASGWDSPLIGFVVVDLGKASSVEVELDVFIDWDGYGVTVGELRHSIIKQIEIIRL